MAWARYGPLSFGKGFAANINSNGESKTIMDAIAGVHQFDEGHKRRQTAKLTIQGTLAGIRALKLNAML